jgi:ribosome-associated protein
VTAPTTKAQAGPPSSLEAAQLAARAAASKQGQSVAILDVRELITITDYFVITSGTSDRQVKTIAEEIERSLKAVGVRPVRVEGESGARWILLDYVDVVVHVFHEEERDYYRLETLWQDAPRVDPELESEAS